MKKNVKDHPKKEDHHVADLRDTLLRRPPAKEAEASSMAQGEDVSAALLAAEEEAKGHYEKLLRVMAEFENFKRRTSKDVEERIRYANEKLLTELLVLIDDLDRVLLHLPPEPTGEVKHISDGVELLRKSFLATLAKFELREIEALGKPFSPSEHEAIATVESNHHDAETVVSVHRRGFWLGDRLLRPALVTVSKHAQREKEHA